LIVCICLVHYEIEGDLEEVIAFGVLFEFILDFLDLILVVGLGGVEVQELVDKGGEMKGLLRGENLWC
jgi:hypothetical protein